MRTLPSAMLEWSGVFCAGTFGTNVASGGPYRATWLKLLIFLENRRLKSCG